MSDDQTHSRFGGSACDAYWNCPGSPAMRASVPARPSDDYSSEGDAAHELARLCLTKAMHPRHYLGETLCDVEVTEDMCAAVVTYLNAVEHEIAQTHTAEFHVEESFTLDVPAAGKGEVHGRNDLLVYHPETGRLRVFDYKHGVGVSVSAEDNKQLKFYAAGAVFSHPDWRLSEVVLTIVQPRARDVDYAGAVKDWPMDTLDLLEFQGDLNECIALALAAEKYFAEAGEFHPNASLNTGSWCRWCDASAMCPARDAETVKDLTLEGVTSVTEVTAASLPEPKALDGARLAAIVAGVDKLQEWGNRCREYLEGMVLAGHDVPGWKAVEKIGRAKWVSDPRQVVGYAAMMFDIDEAVFMPPKLVTITEAEKLIKGAGATKVQVDDFKLRFTVKESSGLTIAPVSDKRPAANPARDFAGVKITA